MSKIVQESSEDFEGKCINMQSLDTVGVPLYSAPAICCYISLTGYLTPPWHAHIWAAYLQYLACYFLPKW